MGENISLLKIKLKKSTETLEIDYVKPRKGKKPQIISIEDGETVHQDFKNAMLGIRIHFALLCEYVTAKQVKDITTYDSELVKDFYVSGITMGGAEDEAYVILTGQKTLSNGKTITINTPHTRIEEDDKTRYRYMKELLERIQVVRDEVMLYLGGKFAPDPQGSLSFPEDDPKAKIKHATIAEPAGGAKGPTSIGEVAAAIVGETNNGIQEDPKAKGGRKGPQTPEDKTGSGTK